MSRTRRVVGGAGVPGAVPAISRDGRGRRMLAIIAMLGGLLVLLIALAGIGLGSASGETPAERCAHETSVYNSAWAASWAAAGPGRLPSQAPPPPVPYVCGQPQEPTTSPTPTTTAPGLPKATDTGAGPQVGAHAPTDIPTRGQTPIETVAPTRGSSTAPTTPDPTSSAPRVGGERTRQLGSKTPSSTPQSRGGTVVDGRDTTQLTAENRADANRDSVALLHNAHSPIPTAIWLLVGAAALTAGALSTRRRNPFSPSVLRRRGRMPADAQAYDGEVAFPVTEGQYAWPCDDYELDPQWSGGDLNTEGNFVYRPDPGQKTGTVEFWDNATPVVSNGDARMSRNEVRIWVNDVDVTDKADIQKTPTGVHGTIKVNELDTVVVRHQSTMNWTEGAGNARINRTATGDTVGVFKTINDTDAMDKALIISEGHGWESHPIPGITTQEEYIDMIYRTTRWAPQSDHKTGLSNHREAWWNNERGVMIVYDPLHEGTAYIPDDGRQDFEDLT